MLVYGVLLHIGQTGQTGQIIASDRGQTVPGRQAELQPVGDRLEERGLGPAHLPP